MISLAFVAIVIAAGVTWCIAADRSPSTDRAERLAYASARDEKFEEILAESRLDEALAAIESIDPDVLAELAQRSGA